MSAIRVRYAALAAVADELVATWRRIETVLADLQRVAGSTASMDAATLQAYRALAARWQASAQERQQVLQALASALRQAGEHYRATDAAMAAQFG